MRVGFLSDDDDIRRFLRNYAAKGRHIDGQIILPELLKPKPSRVAISSVFNQYMAEWLADPARIASADPIEWLAYLNFAAVFSVGIYRELIRLAGGFSISPFWRGTSLCVRRRASSARLPASRRPTTHWCGKRTIVGITAGPGARLRADAVADRAVHFRTIARLRSRARPSWSRRRSRPPRGDRFVHVWQDIGRNWQRIWGFLRRDQFLGFLCAPTASPFAAALPDPDGGGIIGSRSTSTACRNFTTPRMSASKTIAPANSVARSICGRCITRSSRRTNRAQSVGGDFDLIVRLRPDKEIDGADIDWREICLAFANPGRSTPTTPLSSPKYTGWPTSLPPRHRR
jgi:hypothetical protein